MTQIMFWLLLVVGSAVFFVGSPSMFQEMSRQQEAFCYRRWLINFIETILGLVIIFAAFYIRSW
jgi:hypothetical protein